MLTCMVEAHLRVLEAVDVDVDRRFFMGGGGRGSKWILTLCR